MAQVRVPRKGVTQAELTAVLSRRLGDGYAVKPDGQGEVVVRRSALSAAVVRIRNVPGATVFRVRGGGIRWLDSPADALLFARDPGFLFAANLGGRPLPLPPHREVLLASGPLTSGNALPRDTAVWLAS